MFASGYGRIACALLLFAMAISARTQAALAGEADLVASQGIKMAMKVPSTNSLELPTNQQPANLEEEKAAREREVQLRIVSVMNYTSQPLQYQIARTSGPSWTQSYTLPSKMVHRFKADDIRDPSVIRTLNPFGKAGYMFIRFRVGDGWEQYKILTNSSYAYVENTNGFGELVDPSTAQPLARVKAGDETKFLNLLDANHCFVPLDRERS